jgi:hypothetical protein
MCLRSLLEDNERANYNLRRMGMADSAKNAQLMFDV